jgi:predicted site-specific integrase-resolvase
MSDQINPADYASLQELADHFGVTQGTARRWTKQYAWPMIEIAGRKVYHRADVLCLTPTAERRKQAAYANRVRARLARIKPKVKKVKLQQQVW